MSKDEKAINVTDNVKVETFEANAEESPGCHNADNALLATLGYKAEFKREFSVRISLAVRNSGYVI